MPIGFGFWGAGSDKSEGDRSAIAIPSDANPEIQIDCRTDDGSCKKRRRKGKTALFEKNFSLIGTLERPPWGIMRIGGSVGEWWHRSKIPKSKKIPAIPVHNPP